MIKADCPICNKTMERQSLAEWSYFPFCSKRCKLIDLGRWLGESYRIKVEEEEEAAPEETELP